MLGLGDLGVSLAYGLSLGATAVCVVYGCVNWNKPAPEVVAREVAEEAAWERNEPKGGA